LTRGQALILGRRRERSARNHFQYLSGADDRQVIRDSILAIRDRTVATTPLGNSRERFCAVRASITRSCDGCVESERASLYLVALSTGRTTSLILVTRVLISQLAVPAMSVTQVFRTPGTLSKALATMLPQPTAGTVHSRDGERDWFEVAWLFLDVPQNVSLRALRVARKETLTSRS